MSNAEYEYDTSTHRYTVTSGTANDIVNTGTLNLKAANGKSITFGGSITDASTPSGIMNIGQTSSAYTGTVNFNNTVTQNALNLNKWYNASWRK